VKKYLFSLLFLYNTLFASSFVSTGYMGGWDYKLFEKILLNTSLYQQRSEGDIENFRNLFKKENVSLAVVQEDILNDFLNENPDRKDEIVAISPLYKAAIVILTNKNSNINSIKDLSSQRVITDLKGSGSYYTLLKLEELFSINSEIYNMKIEDALKYLKRKKADAIFYIGSLEKIKNENLKIVPLNISIFKKESFKLNGKNITTNYIDKFLVTLHRKIEKISKKDIRILLSNLLRRERNLRDYICSYDLNKLRFKSEEYIYFICSQNIGKITRKEKKAPVKKIQISNKIYFDNIEEIVIYPKALKNENFSFMGTSYIVEKRKLQNALKLLKKSLKEDPNTRVYIISYGEGGEAETNVNMVYRFFKKSHIPRSAIMKKVEPLQNGCQSQECLFKETKIRFKLL